MSAMPATLLIVDNDVHVRKLLEVLLRGQGYQTLTAGSGKEALAMVMQHAPDLILLDTQMPDMDGMELASKIAVKWPAKKILVISGYADDVFVHGVIESSYVDFLAKPFSIRDLFSRVEALLAK